MKLVNVIFSQVIVAENRRKSNYAKNPYNSQFCLFGESTCDLVITSSK